MSTVPTIDIGQWRTAAPDERAGIAGQVDDALRTSGFLLLTNHGVPSDLAASVRAVAREFFDQPDDVKARYASRVGGRGWIPPGAEANSYASGVAAPPDMKESFKVGSIDAGEAAPSGAPVNVWPVEVPQMRAVVRQYQDAVWSLTVDMFRLLAEALGLASDHLARHASRTASSLNLNFYPSLRSTGAPQPGQFRIGAHSDFGALTILDRQLGYGGLEIQMADGSWVTAPHVPDALTVNIGDMMSRWTSGRWRSTVHRVLPPDVRDADEALLSLVSFCSVDPATVIGPLGVDGPDDPEPVLAGDYMRAKLSSIDVLR